MWTHFIIESSRRDEIECVYVCVRALNGGQGTGMDGMGVRVLLLTMISHLAWLA